jgi:hypothetical protein
MEGTTVVELDTGKPVLQLEERTCTCGCKRTFRVLPSSEQRLFSNHCDPNYVAPYNTYGDRELSTRPKDGTLTSAELARELRITQQRVNYLVANGVTKPKHKHGRLNLFDLDRVKTDMEIYEKAKDANREKKRQPRGPMKPREREPETSQLAEMRAASSRYDVFDRHIQERNHCMPKTKQTRPPGGLTGGELAEKLGKNYQTVWAWSNTGKIKPTYPESRYKWKLDDVKAQMGKVGITGGAKPPKEPKRKALGAGIKKPEPVGGNGQEITVRPSFKDLDAADAIRAMERSARKQMLRAMVKLAEKKFADGDADGAYTLLHYVAEKAGLA